MSWELGILIERPFALGHGCKKRIIFLDTLYQFQAVNKVFKRFLELYINFSKTKPCAVAYDANKFFRSFFIKEKPAIKKRVFSEISEIILGLPT